MIVINNPELKERFERLQKKFQPSSISVSINPSSSETEPTEEILENYCSSLEAILDLHEKSQKEKGAGTIHNTGA